MEKGSGGKNKKQIYSGKTNIIKRFFEWIGLKEKLHNQEHIPPFYSRKGKSGGHILEKMLVQK